MAATGASAPRDALPNAGVVYLYDVSLAGRWLVVRVDDYRSARVLLPGQTEERELPWLGAVGGSSPELSPDRTLLLFDDESESAGSNYAATIRKVDGSPPVRLGEGATAGFSPDGSKVLAMIPSLSKIFAYPIGAGDTIRIDAAPLTRAEPRGWLPDGRVVLCGNETSQPFRCYAKRLSGGALEPLTPDGFDVGPISPDGRTIVVIAPDGAKQLSSFASRTLRPLHGTTPLDAVVGWSTNSSALFVQQPAAIPARFEAVGVETGARTLVREVSPPDRAGLVLIRAARVYDDGHAYAYSYFKTIQHLFTVTGVTDSLGESSNLSR